MSGQEETTPRLDPWRYVAIGTGSILDLSGRTTFDAIRKIEPRHDKPLNLIACSWAAVGDALAKAMVSMRREIDR